MLAVLPGMVETTEEYEAQETRRQAYWILQRRRYLATGWLRVLRWRRTATAHERQVFEEGWRHPPHTPEYALDLIGRLSSPMGRERGG